jgi:hypothetical protein
MTKKQNPEPINTGTTKYEVVVDGDDIIQIWKYDKRISKTHLPANLVSLVW